jgi:hypothetical protein
MGIRPKPLVRIWCESSQMPPGMTRLNRGLNRRLSVIYLLLITVADRTAAPAGADCLREFNPITPKLFTRKAQNRGQVRAATGAVLVRKKSPSRWAAGLRKGGTQRRHRRREIARRSPLPRALLVTVRLQALSALVLVHLQTAFLFQVAHGVCVLVNAHRAQRPSCCPARISCPWRAPPRTGPAA